MTRLNSDHLAVAGDALALAVSHMRANNQPPETLFILASLAVKLATEIFPITVDAALEHLRDGVGTLANVRLSDESEERPS